MAGNSQRRGAIRKPGSKKGALKGTGGHGRRALEGKGPTPKAEDRPYHVAHKRKAARERQAAVKAAHERGRERRNPVKIQSGNELIVGRNAVSEAVQAGIPVVRVYLSTSQLNDERVATVVRTATALGAPILEVSRGNLDQASDGAVHQGVGIEVPGYEYADLAELVQKTEDRGQVPLFIALDSVTDPHNLGAVIRSAGAFGAHGVIISQRRSAEVTGTVWKVSAGAVARVPVAQITNLVRELEALKKRGFFVIGLDGEGDVSLRNLELASEPLVLVTGAEGRGLSRLVRETCDQVAAIPISSDVESLNAAVATGVALYEVAGRRS